MSRFRFNATIAAACAAFLLAACGGGGNDDATVSDAQVTGYVAVSNINGLGGTGNGTNRWTASGNAVPTVGVYIPAPNGAVETDLALKARAAIADVNRHLPGGVVLAETATPPATGGYLRVSYLTSYVPAGSTDYASYCGNVATGASLPNVVPASASGDRNQTVAWVNLGNGRCDVSQDIVTHEFGHALGLGTHFEGFGNGPAISRAFWDVLATLYANPVRTPAAQLVVRRAAG